ncbi:Histidine protein kinase DivJ [compost metagenome]
MRAFAKLHGGEMNIESRLGAGTSVSVRMPVLLKASRPAMEAPLLEPLSLPAVEPDDELGPNVVKFAPPR